MYTFRCVTFREGTSWANGKGTLVWKWLLGGVGAVLLLIVVAPVAVTALSGEEPPRSWQYTTLDALTYREVTFENPSQNLKLGGLLFAPEADGPVPGAVLIHGSGTSRRDNAWYTTLVAHLQSEGIAVLLPDKRGSEASAGDWRTASLEDLATDTLTAVRYLRTQPHVPVDDVGVIGLSQGGRIAPIVASRQDDVSFVVNMVGDVLPFYDTLYYEEVNNLRAMGFLPGVAHAVAYPSSWYIRNVAQRPFWEAVGDFDPLPYWNDVDAPALALYGAADTNVDTERSAERLRSLEKPNIDVRIFEGSGHALGDPPGTGDRLIRAEVLDAIVALIVRATNADTAE